MFQSKLCKKLRNNFSIKVSLVFFSLLIIYIKLFSTNLNYPKICRSTLFKIRRKQLRSFCKKYKIRFWLLQMPKKFPKLVFHQFGPVCDSETGKEIFVKFAIAISAFRILEVTRQYIFISI